MIIFWDISKKIKKEIIFKIKYLELQEGIYLILGANGCGKTTFGNILAQKIEFEGKIDSSKIKKKEIEHITQEVNLLNKLTIKENFDFFLTKKQLENSANLIKDLEMENCIEKNKTISKLSGGEQKKIQLIIGLNRDSKILIFDEFENNLDKKSIESIKKKIISQKKKYIFIITHDKSLFQTINDYELLIENQTLNIRTGWKKTNEENKIINKTTPNKSIENIENVKNKNHLSKKNIKTLRKYNKINYIFITIFIFLILFIVNSISLSIVNNLSGIFEVKTKTFSENYSILTAPRYSIEYQKLGDESWLKELEYGFTKEIIQNLKKQDFVENVDIVAPDNISTQMNSILYDEKIIKLTNPYGTSLDYSTLNYEKLKNDIKITNDDLEINEVKEYQIYFDSLYNKQEIFLNTPRNQSGLSKESLVKGEIPKDESNEIAIDIYFAQYLEEKYKFDEIVGKNITIPMNIYENPDVDESISTEDFTFKISGIYASNNPSPIIYSYHKNSINTQMNECSDPKYQTAINSCKFSYASNPLDTNPANPQEIINSDLENYGEAKALYVQTNGTSGEKKLIQYMKEINPYIQIDNNYARTHNSNARGFYMFIIKKILTLLFVIAIFLIFLLFSYKFIKQTILKEINPILKQYYIDEKNSEKIYREQKKLISTIILLCTTLFVFGLLIKINFNFSPYIIVVVVISLVINLISFIVLKMIK